MYIFSQLNILLQVTIYSASLNFTTKTKTYRVDFSSAYYNPFIAHAGTFPYFSCHRSRGKDDDYRLPWRDSRDFQTPHRRLVLSVKHLRGGYK